MWNIQECNNHTEQTAWWNKEIKEVKTKKK